MKQSSINLKDKVIVRLTLIKGLAFKHILKQGKYDFLLTGHTLSDKAETVLFHLCRGAGLKGTSSLKIIQTFKSNSTDFYQFKYQRLNISDFNFFITNYFLLNFDDLFENKNFSILFDKYIFQCYKFSLMRQKKNQNDFVSNCNFSQFLFFKRKQII